MPIPVIFGILAALGLGSLVNELLKSDSELVNPRSDSHNDFIHFNKKLNVPKSKLLKLKNARKAIQKKIKEYFIQLDGYSAPKFYSQGSSQVGTLIRNKKDFCDFDIGVYFFAKPPHTFDTIQKHIKKALTGHTTGKISLRDKCVRINYSGDFHLDMPIYFTEDKSVFFVGSKGDCWEKCDSKLFKDWVKMETENNPQVIRLVRYFKAWADNYPVKLPSGLAFTIWVVKNVRVDSRDDVAFVQTAAYILKNLKADYWSHTSWKCNMPVEPFDNVIGHLNQEQKANLKGALENLIESGIEALGSENEDLAFKKWRSLFGKRFDS